MDKNIQNENLSPDLFQVVGPKNSESEKIERKSLTFWQDARHILFKT